MDLKNFSSAISQISEEKGIPKESVIESIETAIAAAYKKEYMGKPHIIRAKLDENTGKMSFWQIKNVVSEDMIYSEEELEAIKDISFHEEQEKNKEISEEERKIRFNPDRHIILEEAKKIDKSLELGDELKIDLEEKSDFGRIAAQTAKQVILQKIREAERNTILSEYKDKEGEVISGIIQRIEGKNIYVDIGKTLGILPREEQVYGEFYKPNQRLKVYILKTEDSPKGPVIVLSRAHPKMVSKLFEIEVPEIAQGTVVIRSIAREAGSRSKIAVESKMEGVDSIGSTVGQRGTRVMSVINELGGEKIDVIEYSEKPEKFIENAISPSKVSQIKIMPKNKALCVVPEDQLSLAIGRDGQNVRLAAKLTGWKIDIKSEERDEIISTAEPSNEKDSEDSE